MQYQLRGRDRILEAARKLFAEQGFHQTSIAELATASQISVGQIYRLFKSKDDMIAAMVEYYQYSRLADMNVIYEQLKSGTLGIEQAFRELIRSAQTKEDNALSFDIMAEAFRNLPVGLTITNLCLSYKALLRQFAYMANPGLSSEALDAAEELMLACVFGLGLRQFSQPTLDQKDTTICIARILLAGVCNA